MLLEYTIPFHPLVQTAHSYEPQQCIYVWITGKKIILNSGHTLWMCVYLVCFYGNNVCQLITQCRIHPTEQNFDFCHNCPWPTNSCMTSIIAGIAIPYSVHLSPKYITQIDIPSTSVAAEYPYKEVIGSYVVHAIGMKLGL